MFIVYGSREAEIGQIPSEQRCFHCQQENLTAVLFQRYFHIFWIPLFAYEKILYMICPSCGTHFDEPSLQSQVAPEKESLVGQGLKQLKKKVRGPFYHYLGLPILAVIIFFVIFVQAENSNAVESFRREPKTNHLFLVKFHEIELKEIPYVVCLMNEQHGEEFYCRFGTLGFRNFSSAKQYLRDLKSAIQTGNEEYLLNNLDLDSYIISRDQLLEMDIQVVVPILDSHEEDRVRGLL